ncbi:hypothetical protein SAMN05216296_3214 [Pseudomonas pohangensis]|uniref:EamA-like transporter family protein n=1 Tax=Pseudomonas pohangensis TaxID=364197 RepID=A0A1H2HRR7_9PSED|nr:hypothetical protein [Pseudomonas pohangensis]SDU34495.1 hypothetical protein SAMN05216296_3214 [Pseudomonas pohangensis]
MTTTQILLILASVIALSLGQVLFKIAAGSSGIQIFGYSIGMISPALIFALIVYGGATIMWLFVLQDVPLKVAYPFAGMAFFLVPVMSHFFLGEKISLNNIVGAAVICAGVWISVSDF